ncbi:glucosamine-6-phosphate deaminase [Virgibacillus profundi]|uniref:Glucosamine-6-phosphate deaminase n=1 Tax=Virgibacillus profundi TaxID=2024555 RepID=A0A2A2IJ78_9BACI|nr:glucosamine-6-phosphate deaminase [Virgibacillus profundi]PAV31677.1 glucosamine-6-phosphate deaminase [Virgibacillus profundi]PXY55863.1 glucosamine-6-phosphate deaminase [Virgibacillus profundi]
MGRAAAADVIEKMKSLLKEKETIRMVFASAPSQNEFLETLKNASGIDWERVTVFHMDEYIGLKPKSEQSFSKFLCDRLFDGVEPGKIHLINGLNNAANECQVYSELLNEAPIDIVCLGIGENGHIAFNDPPVADFNDPEKIKMVMLDEVSRQQQVNDEVFPHLDDVPTHALTLTIPALMSGSHLYCIVPGLTKREAVRKTLTGLISEIIPASILRRHPDCTLYLDKDSYNE